MRPSLRKPALCSPSIRLVFAKRVTYFSIFIPFNLSPQRLEKTVSRREAEVVRLTQQFEKADDSLRNREDGLQVGGATDFVTCIKIEKCLERDGKRRS